MHKAAFAEIDPHMRVGPAGGIEKHQVSGCEGMHRNWRAHRRLLFGGAGKTDPEGFLNDMGNQPRTVQAFRRRAAPQAIGCAQ